MPKKELNLLRKAARLAKTAEDISSGAALRGAKRKAKRTVKTLSSILVVLAVVSIIAVVAYKSGVLSKLPWLDEKLGGIGLGTSLSREETQIHFIDVGQGDCSLILVGDKSILIDAGDVDYGDRVVSYLSKHNIQELDLIIATHPHADHIGGMDKVIKSIGAKRFIMPKVSNEIVPTSNVFMRMLDALDENDITVDYAKAGEVIELDNATLEILSPVLGKEYDDLNDYSVVTKFNCEGGTFLFTGDIEAKAESDIVEAGVDLSADVLKVAHHGSGTSSIKRFLNEVGAKYAVISLGSPNRYNHPNKDTLSRLENAGYTVLRTDKSGNIIFDINSDGVVTLRG